MSKTEAFYTLKVTDKDGKTVSKVTKPCKSFVLQFLQMLELMSFQDNVTIKEVGGTPTDVSTHISAFKLNAGVANDDYGVLVGTGTTPVDNTDYAMETKIDHGAGAGELNYGESSKVAAAVVGVNVDLQFIRTFTNSSGNTINVTEIGIYRYVATPIFMTLHEIVTLTAVPNGQTLTVTITCRTTV